MSTSLPAERPERALAARGPALFLTAGNARFRPIIEVQLAELARLGYRALCFDLGGLGLGRPFAVEHDDFHAHGHYHERDGWKTRALHKPAIVARALDELGPGEDLVYLDGDAICYERVDELSAAHFDVGVTARWRWDRSLDPSANRYMGRMNAGVIVFRKSEATLRFVAAWAARTEALGNDQRALNTLVNPDYREVTAGDVLEVDGARVLAFDGLIYNNPQTYVTAGIKIIHFKNQRWQRYLADGRLPRPPRSRLYTGAIAAGHALMRALHRLRRALAGRA